VGRAHANLHDFVVLTQFRSYVWSLLTAPELALYRAVARSCSASLRRPENKKGLVPPVMLLGHFLPQAFTHNQVDQQFYPALLTKPAQPIHSDWAAVTVEF